jgi:hypothetical protein
MVGVSEAETMGRRGGIAATVGGSDAMPFLASAADVTASVAAAAAGGKVDCAPIAGAGGDDAAVVLTAGAAVEAGAVVISRTTPAARSASRRLRSSETLSVGEARDVFLAAGLVFCGLGCALGGCWVSLSIVCASTRVGCNAKASEAASARVALARRHIVGFETLARKGVIAARSGSSG